MAVGSPTWVEILDLIVRLYRDPARRHMLQAGYELRRAAAAEGLIDERYGDTSLAACVGELESEGLVKSVRAGGVLAPPPGPWSDAEFNAHSQFQPTAAGVAAANENARALRRSHADAVLEGRLHLLHVDWLDPNAREALTGHARVLEDALAGDAPAAVIGAAKDLVESAAKIVLAAAGEALGRRPALHVLVSQAVQCLDGDTTVGDELARALATTAQRLAELRNTAGTGHGRDVAVATEQRTARLAAYAACGLADYLLAAKPG